MARYSLKSRDFLLSEISSYRDSVIISKSTVEYSLELLFFSLNHLDNLLAFDRSSSAISKRLENGKVCLAMAIPEEMETSGRPLLVKFFVF